MDCFRRSETCVSVCETCSGTCMNVCIVSSSLFQAYSYLRGGECDVAAKNHVAEVCHVSAMAYQLQLALPTLVGKSGDLDKYIQPLYIPQEIQIVSTQKGTTSHFMHVFMKFYPHFSIFDIFIKRSRHFFLSISN